MAWRMGKLSAAELEAYKVDRTGWAPGPWDDEPDRVEWRAEGYACLAVRHPVNGHWCGYVGVPLAHPATREPWRTTDKLSAHRGVNYAEECNGFVCHVAKPGEPDPVFWFGFDCGHGMRDHMPGMDALARTLEAELLAMRPERPESFLSSVFGFDHHGATYRDLPYVRSEVEGLARQLRELDR